MGLHGLNCFGHQTREMKAQPREDSVAFFTPFLRVSRRGDVNRDSSVNVLMYFFPPILIDAMVLLRYSSIFYFSGLDTPKSYLLNICEGTQVKVKKGHFISFFSISPEMNGFWAAGWREPMPKSNRGKSVASCRICYEISSFSPFYRHFDAIATWCSLRLADGREVREFHVWENNVLKTSIATIVMILSRIL